jgi:hypothetical protein
MILDVELSEPAFIYLVWINAAGEILPLYPWNNETLEVTDIQQPPPMRRATKRIFSPLLGRSWTFGDQEGAETVILLARRTSLPQGVNVSMELPSAVNVVLPATGGFVQARLINDGSSQLIKGTSTASPPQIALIENLKPALEHFDFVAAVQFAHENKKAADSKVNGR